MLKLSKLACLAPSRLAARTIQTSASFRQLEGTVGEPSEPEVRTKVPGPKSNELLGQLDKIQVFYFSFSFFVGFSILFLNEC